MLSLWQTFVVGLLCQCSLFASGLFSQYTWFVIDLFCWLYLYATLAG